MSLFSSRKLYHFNLFFISSWARSRTRIELLLVPFSTERNLLLYKLENDFSSRCQHIASIVVSSYTRLSRSSSSQRFLSLILSYSQSLFLSMHFLFTFALLRPVADSLVCFIFVLSIFSLAFFFLRSFYSFLSILLSLASSYHELVSFISVVSVNPNLFCTISCIVMIINTGYFKHHTRYPHKDAKD